MFRKFFLIASLLGLITLIWPILAQDKPKGASTIEQAIEAKNYNKADSILQKEMNGAFAAGNLDTIVYYIPLSGKIANNLHGSEKAAAIVFANTDILKEKGASALLLVKAFRAAADFFSSIGQNKDGYKASEEALACALKIPNNNQKEIARCEYNLGVYAHRLGKVSLSLAHHRKAMLIIEANENTDPEDVYLSANAMGSLMWYASKYDSAALLYNKALAALKKAPDNDVNKYFRPANLQNNLAALFSAEGKTTEAIMAIQNTINGFQNFIAGKEQGPKRESAMEGLFEAIDNLAGIYKEIGDYGKAGQLLQYSYKQKKQNLDPKHPGIFISEILLGQYYNAIYENNTALEYLQSGLTKLENTEGDYLFWAADAYYTLALINENRKESKKAEEFYSKSEALYEESYKGQYDNLYMDFLRSASLFYAKNGNYSKAFQHADKVYQYLIQVGESESLQGFNQLLNIAEINFLTKRYRETNTYCNKALDILKKTIKNGTSFLDSVRIEAFKPKAILINVKAEYELKQNKDSVFLNNLSVRLADALAIIEKKKVLIDDAESINILIADNQELIDFAKKIELQLAQLTGSAFHLDRFVNLHESALYTRIRSRFDKHEALQFSNFPDSMQQTEKGIKKGIQTSLGGDKPHQELMRNYLLAVNRWDTYLDKVKKDFPAYYNMRYETLFKSLPELQTTFTDNITVVRYFFVDTSLLALVIDKHEKKLISLNSNRLNNKIDSLLKGNQNEKGQLAILHELYNTLWKPIASYIKNKKVTIIPDGILFNLNFDMLVIEPMNSFKDFLTKSLLTKHIFSYHYSLFMLDQPTVNDKIIENYVAFAPGFSDIVKQQYLSISKDSIDLDYAYLQLLPQPATNKLTKKIKGMLGGNVFLEGESTKNSFRVNAGGHKIIHIGTHAEFNNIKPEHSGLFFTKNKTGSDNNFLSLNDIYSCSMASNLTILSACESGKPGYQDGEGMVSLAHAFNYAGSQRILMALWKIDEQSSSRITEFFIENIKNGRFTDEALQQAKLQYLEQAEGRLLAPSYWAGLVMLGQPVQLSFENPARFPYWIAASAVILGILIVVYIKYKK